jgi:hypothetical protein
MQEVNYLHRDLCAQRGNFEACLCSSTVNQGFCLLSQLTCSQLQIKVVLDEICFNFCRGTAAASCSVLPKELFYPGPMSRNKCSRTAPIELPKIESAVLRSIKFSIDKRECALARTRKTRVLVWFHELQNLEDQFLWQDSQRA